MPRCCPTHVRSTPGYVAWRGVVPETELTDATRHALDDAITYYVYANSHILVYPIPGRDGSVAAGERLINFVWYRNYLAGDDLDDLLIDARGIRREVSVPPGALRAEHVAEARAVAAARLPAADRRSGAGGRPTCSCRSCSTSRCRGWHSAAPACSAMRRSSFVPTPRPERRRRRTTRGRCATRWSHTRDDPVAALAAWEPGQLTLGRNLLARTRAIGRRSQVDGTGERATRN